LDEKEHQPNTDDNDPIVGVKLAVGEKTLKHGNLTGTREDFGIE
jgi:hypothetical protein